MDEFGNILAGSQLPNTLLEYSSSINDGTFGSFISTTHSTSGHGTHWKWSFADVNGDGNADAIANYIGGSGGTRLKVALSSAPLSNLLISITSELGANTTFQYTPSSHYDNGVLPFILHPVSKITVDDGLGNLSETEYEYSGGLYDFATREFRGFEYVKRINPEPDLTTVETWFHQNEYFNGRQYKVEMREPWDPDPGAIFARTDFTWEKVPETPPEGSHAFVKLTQKYSEFYVSQTVYTQEDYTYDDTNGNLLTSTTSGTDAEDITTTSQYANYGDWLWRMTQQTIEGSLTGKVREFYYGYESTSGNMLYKEQWLETGTNPRINMTYDAYGNRKTLTDAKGNTTTTDYDTAVHTYPVKVTYPSTGGISHIVEYGYDYRYGKVTSDKDENGNWTYYGYDPFGRLEQVDSPDGGQTIIEYYDNDFPRYVLTKVKEDATHTIDKYEYYDGMGRPIQTITKGENSNIVTRQYYDEMGRNDLTEGPYFATGVGYPKEPPAQYPWVETQFDLRGRPQIVESPDYSGHTYRVNQVQYSYNGLTTTITDPDGKQRDEKKDYLGRLVLIEEIISGGTFETYYSYNAAGDLRTVTDEFGNTTHINYDTLGRKINMTDPDMGYWVYTYDDNGNLESQADAKSQTISFSYDELNRLTTKTYSTSDPTVSYTYDNISIPNGKGTLYSVTNGLVTTTNNGYDEMGRVTSVTRNISGDSARTTQYEYDLSGK